MSYQYKRVTAIIICEKLAEVEQALVQHHIAGVSVNKVQGYGEYDNYYRKDMMTCHYRIEIFCHGEQAEEISRCIMDAARTGMEGDGIVAIMPADTFYHIRTGDHIAPYKQPAEGEG